MKTNVKNADQAQKRPDDPKGAKIDRSPVRGFRVDDDRSRSLATLARTARDFEQMLTQDPKLVTIGNVLADFRATPNGRHAGNKHDAELDVDLGGCPINTGVFGPVNGLSTAAVSAQKKGMWSGISRGLAAKKGIRLMLQERDTGPAASLITPNGVPGRFDIFTQRLDPPTVNELTPEIRGVLNTARAVIVGPMRWTDGTRDLLLHLPTLVPNAYRALIPHRDMIGDPAFALIAQRYNYVQINAEESRLMDGATSDTILNARRLSFLVGETNEVAVTAAESRGYLWSGRWLPIDPPKVTLVDDTGCGDAFAAAYVIGRVFMGLRADLALLYSIDAAAATANHIGVSEALPYESPRRPCRP